MFENTLEKLFGRVYWCGRVVDKNNIDSIDDISFYTLKKMRGFSTFDVGLKYFKRSKIILEDFYYRNIPKYDRESGADWAYESALSNEVYVFDVKKLQLNILVTNIFDDKITILEEDNHYLYDCKEYDYVKKIFMETIRSNSWRELYSNSGIQW